MRLLAPCALLCALAPAAALSSRGPGGQPQCASINAPFLLRADNKLSPSLGTALAPSLAWAVPASQASVDAVHVRVFSYMGATIWDTDAVPVSSPWGITYAGPPLLPGTPFLWCVSTRDARSGTWSPFSANASFVTGLWRPADWSAGVEPVWGSANTSARFVLLRGALPLPPTTPSRTIVAAYAFATAQSQQSTRDHENGKLLGAYKLWVQGSFIGLGPGRPGKCGPVCPNSGSPGVCTCVPEMVYDVLDITAPTLAAAASGAGNLSLALACYSAPGPDAARVLLQVSIHYADGSVLTGGTGLNDAAGVTWAAFDGTDWMSPSCCAENAWFYQPQENFRGDLEPIGWSSPGYVPSTPLSWLPVVAAGPFFAPLVPRTTLSLSVDDGIIPTSTYQRTALATGDLVRVYDLGREIQGGINLIFPPDTPAGAVYKLQLGEELLDDGTVMYEMRTGNNYTATLTSRGGGGPMLAMHEYAEFRYAQVAVAGSSVGRTCATSTLEDYHDIVTLSCGETETIKAFTFASWGTPSGSCNADNTNDFAVNATCAYAGTRDVLTPLCVGRSSCSFVPSDAFFGGSDPCDKTAKRLAAAWTCSGGPPPPPPPPPPFPEATAWQVYYPASFASDAADACEGGAASTGVAGGSTNGTGAFTSSSPELNRIFSFCEYTVRTTNLDLMTDSNTRQRSPGCAEAMLATSGNQGASSYESASQAYITEYVLNGSPGGAGWAEWQALLISSVHMLWLATGDISIITSHAHLLEAYLERELVSNATRLWTCNATNPTWKCEQPEVDWPMGMRDGFVFKDANTVVNAHYVGALEEYSELMAAIGDTSAAALAAAQADDLSAAMRASLYNSSARAFVDGLGTTHAAIHSTAYAAARGVAGADATMAASLWHTLLSRLDAVSGIPVGPYPALFYGEALFANTSDYGRTAISRFLLNNGTNSWLNQLRQNATTTMEAWTPGEKPNLTWSHPWMALPLQLIVRWLLGVRALTPGAGTVIVQPQPGPLLWGSGVAPTLRGPVAVAWSQQLPSEGALPSVIQLNITIPGAVVARVCLPLSACGSSGKVTVDGTTVQGVVDGAFACVDGVAAGVHSVGCGV